MFSSLIGRRPLAGFGLAMILSAFLAPVAHAQPMANRVPSDAIVYVGWMGFEDKSPGFAGSHLEAVMKEANFQQLVDETFPKLLQMIREKYRNAADAINIARPIVLPMLKHQTAFFLGTPQFNGRNQPPKIKAGLICQAGADTDAMYKQLDDLLSAAPQEIRDMVKLQKQPNTVAILCGYDAIPAEGASLAASADFKAMAPHMVPNASMAVYVDVDKFVAALNQAVDTYGPPEAQQYWPKVRDAIGLQGVKHFIATSGFDGKDWADHIFLHAPAPRQGLFTLADHAPLSPAAMKIIPSTATMAGAAKFDVAKLVAALRNAVNQVEPQAGAKVDDLLAQARRSLGMDLQKDILETLGDEWVYYVDPMTGGRSQFGAVWINHLRDPAKAEAAFSKLESMLNDELAKNIHEKDVKIRFLTTKSGDTTIHYLGTPLVSPAWAVKGEYVVIGLFPQMVAGAVEQIGGNGPSILDNPKFKAVQQRLGVANATSFAFVDLQETAPDGYALWTAISRLTGVGDMFGVPAPAMILPPLRKLMPHMAPAGSVSWVDNDGIHVKGIQPFPGSTVIGSDPLGGLLGTVPGLVVPFMAQRRQATAETRRAEALDAAQPQVVPVPPAVRTNRAVSPDAPDAQPAPRPPQRP